MKTNFCLFKKLADVSNLKNIISDSGDIIPLFLATSIAVNALSPVTMTL